MKRITLKQIVDLNDEGKRKWSGNKDMGYQVISLENTTEPRIHTLLTTSEVKKLIRHKYKVTIR